MIRYTTPTITLIVETVIPASDIYVTFKQGKKKLTKDNPSVTVGDTTTTLLVPMTQEETAEFDSKDHVQVQVNWITPSGERYATRMSTVAAFENLLDEVIHYGD